MASAAGRGAILFASLWPIAHENRYETCSFVYIALKKQYRAISNTLKKTLLYFEIDAR